MGKIERKELKDKIREKIRAERLEAKRLRSLPAEERKAAKEKRKGDRAAEKEALASMAPEDRKERKRFLRKYGSMKRRPVTLSVWGAVILTPLAVLLVNIIAALTPQSDEIQAARSASALVAEQIQAEGTVLLQNDGDVLPLGNRKVNVFGTRAVSPSYGGGGSGSINSDNVEDFYDVLDSAGLEVNRDLANLFTRWRYEGEVSTDEYRHKKRKNLIEIILPNIVGVLGSESFDELDPDLIPESVIADAKKHSDTALYMIGSFSREAISDSGFFDKTKEQLSISELDRRYLEMLDREFENVVVLINSGNPMELGWIDEFPHVKALLWIGFPGEAGSAGIAKILTGEYNPSGKLVDTFAYDVLSSPAAQLTGNYGYDNLEDEHFINYTEGIYVGYRFYETYYDGDEEGYRKAVQYPFGHGLSYTDFEWETVGFETDTEEISLSVRVTNSGDRAGKEVVQVYYTPPWYETSGIEKSSVNLAGFAKTKELEPGESQRVTIAFPLRDMASYDYKNREAWILEKGVYTIKTARNAHDAEDEGEFILSEDIVYTADERTGHKIENLFDDANGGLNYLSRSDFDGTMATMADFNYEAPASVKEALQYTIDRTEGEMPDFGEDNGLRLSDLAGLAYEDPKWDLFLDQFSLKEMIKMVSAGGWQTIGIKRLGIPKTLDYDGPSSIRHYFGKWATLGFPSAIVVSQTWNGELQYEMARSIAGEAVLHGIHVWYAPGMNIHRSALGSRSFEYFSEDPLVSGKAASALIRGASSRGMTVTMKHFAMNNQDTNRTGVFTWANEQSMREIYFKSFEMSVKEGGAFGAMSAMNRIGHTWCGDNPALLNDLLRDEWGFRGFVVTDITIGSYMRASSCITNGNDLMLFLTSGKHEKDIKEAFKADPVGIAEGLRTSVHNICYMVLQTYAMESVE